MPACRLRSDETLPNPDCSHANGNQHLCLSPLLTAVKISRSARRCAFRVLFRIEMRFGPVLRNVDFEEDAKLHLEFCPNVSCGRCIRKDRAPAL